MTCFLIRAIKKNPKSDEYFSSSLGWVIGCESNITTYPDAPMHSTPKSKTHSTPSPLRGERKREGDKKEIIV